MGLEGWKRERNTRPGYLCGSGDRVIGVGQKVYSKGLV